MVGFYPIPKIRPDLRRKCRATRAAGGAGSVHRQPLSTVAGSSASHRPVAVGGDVARNELSWCGTTSPPILGCCAREGVCECRGAQHQPVQTCLHVWKLPIAHQSLHAFISSQSCCALARQHACIGRRRPQSLRGWNTMFFISMSSCPHHIADLDTEGTGFHKRTAGMRG